MENLTEREFSNAGEVLEEGTLVLEEYSPEEEYTDLLLPDISNTLESAQAILDEENKKNDDIDEVLAKLNEATHNLYETQSSFENEISPYTSYVESFGETVRREAKEEKIENYEVLVNENIISKEYCENLNKLNNTIDELKQIQNPSILVLNQLNKLIETKDNINSKLLISIKEKKATEERKNIEIKDEIFNTYSDRIESLTSSLEELLKHPLVVEYFKNKAEKEAIELENKIKLEKENFEKKIRHQGEVLKLRSNKFLKIINNEHQAVFKRFARVMEKPEIIEEINEVLEKNDSEREKKLVAKIRTFLLRAIKEGEGKNRIYNPTEVAVWEKKSLPVEYDDMFEFLNSTSTKNILKDPLNSQLEGMKELHTEIKKVIKEESFLSHIVGNYEVYDKKTGEMKMGAFWSAFEKRKENDAEKLNEDIKNTKTEVSKKEQESRNKIEEIIKEGGFEVKTPVYNKNGDIVGFNNGAIKLEEGLSKKGTPIVKVVAFEGHKNTIAINTTYLEDLRNAPAWLREAYLNFKKKNKKN